MSPMTLAVIRHLAYGLLFVAHFFAILKFVRFRPQSLQTPIQTPIQRRHYLTVFGIVIGWTVLLLVSGAGLNNDVRLLSPSLWIHAGGCWTLIQSATQPLWHLFVPSLYYLIDATRDTGMGHFRPFQWVFLGSWPHTIQLVSIVAFLIHACNAVGLLWLASKWKAHAGVAIGAAALFAVHPITMQSLSNTDSLMYSQGFLFLILSMGTYDQYGKTGQQRWLGLVALGLIVGCLCVESYLGVMGWVALWTWLRVCAGEWTKRRAVMGLVFVGSLLTLLGAIILIMELGYAPANRFGMLTVTLWRLLMTTGIETYGGFFLPVEPDYGSVLLYLLALPVTFLVFSPDSDGWNVTASAWWLTAPCLLGPALAFVEVTSGAWSGARLLYAPTFLLCLALAMLPARHLLKLRVATGAAMSLTLLRMVI